MSDAGRLRFSLNDPALTMGGGSLGDHAPLRRVLAMDGPETSGGGDISDAAERVRQLTQQQRDCLRLVVQHMTSKDIARTLDVSPHTVDMRLRTAIRALGVASRLEAARMLIDVEGATAYQPLIYQAPELVGEGDGSKVGAPVSAASPEHAIQPSTSRIRPDDGPPAGVPPRPAGAPQPEAGVEPQPEINPLAGSLPWGPRNDLSAAARLSWIAVIAIGAALGFGAIVGALEALGQLL